MPSRTHSHPRAWYERTRLDAVTSKKQIRLQKAIEHVYTPSMVAGQLCWRMAILRPALSWPVIMAYGPARCTE